MTLVLTSCTNRKRLPAPPRLRACTLKPGTLATVMTDWLERLATADRLAAASDLYCGRAFRQAQAAVESTRGRLLVVSAGLGLVEANTRVPAYSLTVVSGTKDNILDRIAGRPSVAEWWQALGQRSTFGLSLKEGIKSSRGPILVALSAQYLTMIAPDLFDLPEKTRKRLRIFSLSSRLALPQVLSEYVMPYDARFDGSGAPLPGTRGDFAQRAMAHFAETILSQYPEGDIECHTKAINRRLSSLLPPEPLCRTKVSDDEIVALIHRHWSDVQGRSGRMLRFLRDDLGIACEQSRFRDLFIAAAKDVRL